MNEALTQQLAAWLAATDIDWLELRGPGLHLCLRQLGGRVEQASPDAMPPPAGTAPAAETAVPVTAPSVGICLHSHPLHDTPLAAAGQPVAAGQPIALLRIGVLLLPVLAPQDGLMLHHRVASGTLVGYGTVLAELIPYSPG